MTDSDSDSDYGPQVPARTESKTETLPIKTEEKDEACDSNRKRKRENDDKNENTSENDEQPVSKKAKLQCIYLDRLPKSDRYEYSWMHRKMLSFVVMAPTYDFLITTSMDGVIKFWKKLEVGIEFVKEYRGHTDYVQCMDVSDDGTLLITMGNDGNVCIFDIATFDMVTRFVLSYAAGVCCWLSGATQAQATVAISERESAVIRVYKPISHGDTVMYTIGDGLIHAADTKIVCLCYNAKYECGVSSDACGNLEFWSVHSPFDRPSTLSFEFIADTDYRVYRERKLVPYALSLSASHELIAIASSDDFVRVFEFASGRMRFAVDESIAQYQRDNERLYHKDAIEFGKHIAVERQLKKEVTQTLVRNEHRWLRGNIVFDAHDRCVLYATMMGVKVLDARDGTLLRMIGTQEPNVRFLHLCLFQGVAHTNLGQSHAQRFGTNTILASSSASMMEQAAAAAEDPCVFVSAYQKDRFYMFSNRTNDESDEHRDIQNEKPTRMHSKIATHATHRTLGTHAIIRTTFGDIYLKLFPIECPKTVENFCVHSLNGYYNNVIFHRVIRGFMIQTGDPKGDSTGGESIWGGVFDDEFHRSLKHDRPGTLSMANAGANSNGSQFFITTAECRWLDNKHTVFGRVTKGMDVVQAIECVKADKVNKKPVDAIKIINIDVDTQ